ncbi:kinase-like domain-containing protein [Lactifluus subvellereus]|nr:kinase-like domain-containing protein [Lactifluus subvellereus]
MQFVAAQRHPPSAALKIAIAYGVFTFCACCPLVVVHILVLSLQALVLFTVPLCVLAYHSHTHMQTKPVAPLSAPLPLVRRRSADTTLVAPSPRELEVDDPFLRSSATLCARLLRLPLTAPHRRPLGPQSRFLYDGEWQYRVDGLIGAGTFGRVALATVLGTSPPARVAIKVFNKARLSAGPTLPEMYEVEQRIMLENAREDAKWLVQLRGSFTDPWNCYLVMDYYPNTLAGVIFSYGNWLPDNIARVWIEELAMAMYELFQRGIVHCDLKPGNILVTADGHLAIADFGISVVPELQADKDKTLDKCVFFAYGGTYAYQAPELLITHSKAKFTCAVDMWSLGVIIYELYTGKRLFSAEASGVRNEVWGWDIPTIIREDIKDELAQNLVTRLLEVDPSDRLKVTELAWHPYFDKT